jgi:hypothetical protein
MDDMQATMIPSKNVFTLKYKTMTLSSGPKVHAPARSDEDAQNFYR